MFFFFFKQKTAYEMRISDWSSDVCSSDLVASDYDFSVAAHFDTAGYPILHFVERNYAGDPSNWWIPNAACTQAMLRSSGFRIAAHPEDEVYLCQVAERPWGAEPVYPQIGRASCRERVCQYVSISVVAVSLKKK